MLSILTGLKNTVMYVNWIKSDFTKKLGALIILQSTNRKHN